MANAIKWSTPGTYTLVINGDGTAPTLKYLSDAGKKIGNEIDNSTAKDRWASFVLNCKLGSAPTLGRTFDLYLIPCVDGTNYADGSDSVVPSSALRAGSWDVQAVNTAQVLALVNVPIPPHKFKPLVINNTGQSTTNVDNENKLSYRTYNEEIQ